MKNLPAPREPEYPTRKKHAPLRRDESLFYLYFYLLLGKPLPPGRDRHSAVATSAGHKGWILGGCGILGVVVLVTLGATRHLEGGNVADPGQGALPRDGDTTEIAHQSAREPVEVALRFLRAETAGAKASLTRFPARNRDRIHDFYSGKTSMVEKVIAFRDLGLIVTAETSFYAFAVLLEGGFPHLVAVVEHPDGTLAVDWECYSCRNDPGWDDLASLPFEGLDYPFRVLARATDYYNKRFADETIWACFALSTPAQDRDVHGYCRRDSPTHAALREVLLNASDPQRVMVRLRGGIDTADSNQFEITAFLRKEWVAP